MRYTVGQVAKIFGESVHTFRYYDKEGLLPFTKRDENGIRYYEDSDLEIFGAIQCLKHAHMPLKDIAKFVTLFMQGDSTIAERREMFENLRENLRQELAQMQEVYDNVRFRCWFFAEAEKAGTVAIKHHLDTVPIPDDLKPLREKYGKQLQLLHERK